MQPDKKQYARDGSAADRDGAAQNTPAPERVEQGDAPVTGWQFSGGAEAQQPVVDMAATDPMQEPAAESVEWTASEYVAHDKSPSWYMALALVAVLLMVAVYFLTGRDIVSVVVVPVVAVLFGYSAARRPQVRRFAIDNRGITMGSRFHPFGQLKSFTVGGEGIRSIMLMPLKRYMPPVSMYYPPEQEERIMQVLSQYLPYEPERHDNVERVMRRIKF